MKISNFENHKFSFLKIFWRVVIFKIRYFYFWGLDKNYFTQNKRFGLVPRKWLRDLTLQFVEDLILSIILGNIE